MLVVTLAHSQVTAVTMVVTIVGIVTRPHSCVHVLQNHVVSVGPHSPGNCQILAPWGGGGQEARSTIHFSLNEWVLSSFAQESFVIMPTTRAALAFLQIAKALRNLLPLEFIMGSSLHALADRALERGFEECVSIPSIAAPHQHLL